MYSQPLITTRHIKTASDKFAGIDAQLSQFKK